MINFKGDILQAINKLLILTTYQSNLKLEYDHLNLNQRKTRHSKTRISDGYLSNFYCLL